MPTTYIKEHPYWSKELQDALEQKKGSFDVSSRYLSELLHDKMGYTLGTSNGLINLFSKGYVFGCSMNRAPKKPEKCSRALSILMYSLGFDEGDITIRKIMDCYKEVDKKFEYPPSDEHDIMGYRNEISSKRRKNFLSITPSKQSENSELSLQADETAELRELENIMSSLLSTQFNMIIRDRSLFRNSKLVNDFRNLVQSSKETNLHEADNSFQLMSAFVEPLNIIFDKIKKCDQISDRRKYAELFEDLTDILHLRAKEYSSLMKSLEDLKKLDNFIQND